MTAVTGLGFSDAQGMDLGYDGLWIGNVPPPSDEGSAGRPPSLLSEMFRAARKDDQLPTTVQVDEGVPVLSGSLVDQDGVSAPAVAVTVTDPDGVTLPSTETWTDDLVVHYDSSGYLVSFLVKDPRPGTWTVEASYPQETGVVPNFQLFVSTLPTSNDQADITQTLEDAFGDAFAAEQVDAIIARYGLSSTRCFWCRLGVASLALLIVIAVSVALSYLTVQSAPVIALAAWASLDAGVVLTFIKTLVAIVVYGVNGVIIQICAWAGACSLWKRGS